jgi:prolyl-tRNA synthetase
MTLPVTRAQNYPDWYQEVVTAADMAENSSVRGCMVIKPWGYGIWERMRDILDRKIKDTGHDNAYFPLFIPLKLFEKEAEHIDGFAKEMALVTHTKLTHKDGKLQIDGPLDEPLVVRPTSEMIISQCFSNWITSYRDLPVLINQWANVVRWEMRTRLFLRTTEFLWQEGHTAHASKEEAIDETLLMLEQYRQLIEDNMAIPVILGKKPDYDRFPGAVDTYTLEAMMQDGRALQMGTSHYLGQTFAKASNIRYQSKSGEMEYVHTTSWGVSTRMVGGLIMTHSDDIGLRLPPAIAPKQIVIVPILRDDENDTAVLAYAAKLAAELKPLTYKNESVRVYVDKRDRPAPDKKWEWLKKGAPLLIEIGPRDVESNKVAVRLRTEMDGKPRFIAYDEFVAQSLNLLEQVHIALHEQALAYHNHYTNRDIKDFTSFKAYFSDKNAYLGSGKNSVGFVRAPWCGDAEITETLLKELAVTIRCLPIDQATDLGPCVLTGKPAQFEAIFARNY